MSFRGELEILGNRSLYLSLKTLALGTTRYTAEASAPSWGCRKCPGWWTREIERTWPGEFWVFMSTDSDVPCKCHPCHPARGNSSWFKICMEIVWLWLKWLNHIKIDHGYSHMKNNLRCHLDPIQLIMGRSRHQFGFPTFSLLRDKIGGRPEKKSLNKIAVSDGNGIALSVRRISFKAGRIPSNPLSYLFFWASIWPSFQLLDWILREEINWKNRILARFSFFFLNSISHPVLVSLDILNYPLGLR